MDREAIVPKAALYLGRDESVTETVIAYLQRLYCPSNRCGSCVSCRQIYEKQFHAVRWYTPAAAAYTLADLDPIFSEVALQQKETAQFFVLQRADLLSEVCANKLLKILEDAPNGYHFILCAWNEDSLPATVRSRCFIKVVQGTTLMIEHPLYTLFCSEVPCSFEQLQTTIEQCKELSRYELVSSIEQLMSYWSARISDCADAAPRVTFLFSHLDLITHSTNNALFVRALYLQWVFLYRKKAQSA
jgi:hypothetical protein